MKEGASSLVCGLQLLLAAGQRTASVGEESGQGDPLVYRSDGTLERT